MATSNGLIAPSVNESSESTSSNTTTTDNLSNNSPSNDDFTVNNLLNFIEENIENIDNFKNDSNNNDLLGDDTSLSKNTEDNDIKTAISNDTDNNNNNTSQSKESEPIQNDDQQNATLATPSSSSSSPSPTLTSKRESLEYLKELFHDRERLSIIPLGIFFHLNRLIDQEILRVRASLIHIDGSADQRKQLVLPEPEGAVVQRNVRIWIPADKYPDYNFIGRIIGPRGLTIRELEADCGCKFYIRGKGSLRNKEKEEKCRGQPNWEHLNESLHVLIIVEDAENRADIKVQYAVEQINKLIDSVISHKDDFKIRQLAELAILNDKFNSKLNATAAAAAVSGGAIVASSSGNNNLKNSNCKSAQQQSQQSNVVSQKPMMETIVPIITGNPGGGKSTSSAVAAATAAAIAGGALQFSHPSPAAYPTFLTYPTPTLALEPQLFLNSSPHQQQALASEIAAQVAAATSGLTFPLVGTFSGAIPNLSPAANQLNRYHPYKKKK